MAETTNAIAEELVGDPQGRMFWTLFLEAAEDHRKGDREKSESTCRLLLSHATLGDYVKAGVHTLLSCGQDNILYMIQINDKGRKLTILNSYHAEQAVFLYENLFTVYPGGSYDGSFQPTEAQLTIQKEQVTAARKHLAGVKETMDKIEADYQRQMKEFKDYHGRDPTDDELIDRAMEKNSEAVNAYYAEVDEIEDNMFKSAPAAPPPNEK